MTVATAAPAAPTDVASEYVTVTQAAARAGKCEDTIRNWLSSGRLKKYRLLGRPVVALRELETLLAGAPARA